MPTEISVEIGGFYNGQGIGIVVCVGRTAIQQKAVPSLPKIFIEGFFYLRQEWLIPNQSVTLQNVQVLE